MKINFLGDSITAGAGASCVDSKYVNRVGEMLGAEVRNYGICGTRIARQTKPSLDAAFDYDFVSRVAEMEADADKVFVFGGTNDYGHGDAALGDADSTDVYTFGGAVNTLIGLLSEKYGKEKLCFILPIHRYNEDSPYGEGNKERAGEPLSSYVALLKAVLKKQGVDYLDLSHLFPVPLTNTGDGLTVDGLHPNDGGHQLIADAVCTYLQAN